jgi:hypothetical protein
VLNIYRSLGTKERALVWVAVVAVAVLVASLVVGGAGLVAGAQIVAAVGTLALAGLAFAQVREMREARLAQERPQVIVDADYSPNGAVKVVVRNIGKGAARNITFDFSAPMVSSLSLREGSEIPPVNELPYFEMGIEFLAPGAEIVTLWDSAIGLFPVLRERGLEDGITITSKYWSLDGEYHETPWTINPLRIATVDTPEKEMRDLVKEVERIRKDFQKVIGPISKELRVSTATEREQRRSQSDDEGS